VRDLTRLGEAILIVPSSVLKNGVTELDVELGINTASKDAESENRETEEATDLALQGIEVTAGLEEVSVTGGGIRGSKDSDEEDGEPEAVKHKRRKKLSKDANSREARFLSRFAVTKKCRRKIWDEFFQNVLKRKSIWHWYATVDPHLSSSIGVSREHPLPTTARRTVL
jgi:hypothetical protein